ncbi:methyl-accepting chemotaxis protein [Polaromonas sp. JS666]|uniref:methyl-accepting chemotaxis protein n=1 Tax=Polaromonas sp. (strain JS666 / ATCC BAA-500) TaxID=296591 RepID=UPI000046410D|nr:methyl-accepting chemotaxis protein [Polaromonas sp. JS666]ABE44382.1 methyl-accepting chemotaxis sensory transducer [Polaromonas sp. JS666]
MDWLANVPIRTKLLLISVLTSAIALLLAGAAIIVYDTITYTDQKKREISVQAETLAASVTAALAFNDAKVAEEYLKAFEANPEIAAAGIYTTDARLFARYMRSGLSTRALPTAAEPAGERFKDDELEVFRPIKDGARTVGTVYLRANTESLAIRIARFGGIILLVLVGSLVITLPISIRMQRVISHPIQDISRAASLIAAGDLTATLPVQQRSDEIGLLVEMFTRMAEGLREQIRGLIEGATVLGSAASDIVASTTQLSVSASESAVIVSETTVTVEEVRQTAQVASQKAKNVADSAQKAAQISQNGRKSTEDVAAGMNRIRLQMEAIAVSMTRLSEQSQAIGRIMATVEDLAAQSNLLAVNAAIEAAKAGEHGKGFGVVAQEVKSLAEQSRQATNQVRTILGDIQKATTTAMMATEQGSKAVEAGTRQTEVASESIQALTASVNEATQAATQIAASSQQQLVGVDQVAGAMESIKQASTQNVAGARQLEVAARNLNELGQRLKQMVERYKV